MKKLIYILFLLPFLSSAQMQIYGKKAFMDSLAFRKYKNNIAGDSVLSVDVNGRVVLRRVVSADSSFVYANGLTKRNDSVLLGGTLVDSITTISVGGTLKTLKIGDGSAGIWEGNVFGNQARGVYLFAPHIKAVSDTLTLTPGRTITTATYTATTSAGDSLVSYTSATRQSISKGYKLNSDSSIVLSSAHGENVLIENKHNDTATTSNEWGGKLLLQELTGIPTFSLSSFTADKGSAEVYGVCDTITGQGGAFLLAKDNLGTSRASVGSTFYGGIGQAYLSIPNQSSLTLDSVNGFRYIVEDSVIFTVSTNGNSSFWKTTGNAGTDTSVNFIGTTDSANFILQPNTGNVGIGITTPQAKLDILGSLSQTVTYPDGTNGAFFNGADPFAFGFYGAACIKQYSLGGYTGLTGFVHGNGSGGINNDPAFWYGGIFDFNLHYADAEFRVDTASGKYKCQFGSSASIDTSVVMRSNQIDGFNFQMLYPGDSIIVKINAPSTVDSAVVVIQSLTKKGLQIQDGTQSNGYVLTSDANGLGSWQQNALTATATLDYGSIGANSHETLTVTVTGAALSDVVSIGIPNASMNDHASFVAWVSATNTVSIKCFNFDGSSFNPAAGVFTVKVFKN